MGSQILPRALEDIGLEITSQFDPYDVETQNKDYYIGAEILLPRGEEMERGNMMSLLFLLLLWQFILPKLREDYFYCNKQHMRGLNVIEEKIEGGH